MNNLTIALIIIAVIVVAVFVALYFVGKKLQKKQEESEAQMKAAAQTVSLLVIDKKKMKLKDANLPKIVLEQTPKYMRGSKVPIVKAKIGPKVMSLICDAKVFDIIPVKKEVKAVVSGIYIMNVRGLRSNLETKKEKQGFFKKLGSKFKKDK
ncbi:MAG: hypothetical protein GX306_07070 [Clostridiales bacterium]|jgi:hypothetical protein|nr:hypothetical protein [Clostridiales bacterium]